MASPNMLKLKAKLDKLVSKPQMIEIFAGTNRKQRRAKAPDLPRFTKKRTRGRP